MANCPGLLKLVILLASIPRTMFWRKTKVTGLGSYTLTKVSTPPVNDDTPILSSRFNPTKKYPLDLNFYWAVQKPT